ncbi:histidine phosphatase family protein [Pseudoalteromonas sp. B62]|uniref:histidine phosphatase family protein n=1 Tax=Pseudoalteromonas sp. B62 TaxID=630483 RepID=UPI00301C1430
MCILYLVRHGQASFGADDYDNLSVKGQQQATLVGEYLAQKQLIPDVVITGTMQRHNQTAELSLASLNNTSAVINDARLNEYDHEHILAASNPELTTPSQVHAVLSKQVDPMEYFKTVFINAIEQWMLNPDSTLYKECFNAFCARVLGALEKIAKEHDGKKVIIYTSGGPISIITSHLMGLKLERFIDINWGLVNAGVTKVVARGRGSSRKLGISSLNEHHFLEQYPQQKLITYT